MLAFVKVVIAVAPHVQQAVETVLHAWPKKTARRTVKHRKHARQVFRAAGRKCHYCGTRLPFKLMEIDHKTPLKRGGSDSIDNLVAACAHCNRRKGSMSYRRFMRRTRHERRNR